MFQKVMHSLKPTAWIGLALLAFLVVFPRCQPQASPLIKFQLRQNRDAFFAGKSPSHPVGELVPLIHSYLGRSQ